MYGIPAAQGLIVRMSDKMTRISNLLKREAQVKDESIQDTLADLCNYAAILSAYIEDQKSKQNKTHTLHWLPPQPGEEAQPSGQ